MGKHSISKSYLSDNDRRKLIEQQLAEYVDLSKYGRIMPENWLDNLKL